jgi:RNA polymerase sigma factor (sigma-70 family)
MRQTRYFDTIQDLSLTDQQEALLHSLMPIVHSVCSTFSVKLRSAGNDRTHTSYDDMVQMAMVKLVLAIKRSGLIEIESSVRYYTRVVSRACLTQIHKARIRDYKNYHCDLDAATQVPSAGSVEDKILVEQLLAKVPTDITRKVLIHYYGIDCAPKSLEWISDNLHITRGSISRRLWQMKQKLKKE